MQNGDDGGYGDSGSRRDDYYDDNDSRGRNEERSVEAKENHKQKKSGASFFLRPCQLSYLYRGVSQKAT